MTAYYNEIDPYAAQWLRNLISAGHIAPGDVDERSIADVQPDELAGYVQCHFFAGIGVWSYALRQAGWDDSRPVWTGSCPCQPFSSAGKRAGTKDDRHLWPEWQRLIAECRPGAMFGEQVSGPGGRAWWDLVSADLESLGYSRGALDTCAAGVGAPHIRPRLYWVAHTSGNRCQGSGQIRKRTPETVGCGASGNLAHTLRQGREGTGENKLRCTQPTRGAEPSGGCGTGGHWRGADWLPCADNKARPVEPGTFPLANGAPGRVGRLRAYGNGLCAPQAQAFIEAATNAMQEMF